MRRERKSPVSSKPSLVKPELHPSIPKISPTGLRPLVERSGLEDVKTQSFVAVESLNVSVGAGVLLHHLDGCKNNKTVLDEEYATSMLERYGEDVTQHPVGDVELWERAQGGKKFGIGSSDSSFIITGTPSSSSGSTPSYAEYQRSQEKVQELQSQVEELHNRVEDVHDMREEIQQQMREEMKEEMQ
ncbi:hypothetical protein E3N88_06384 [Mikania micrantha]|uniref:Uncharacterized protein n=1 Tax=Mikania micrantha TaxID=192012 RepID=A0A5N6PNM6_9ASTR|nr:hypothetical protein E3N88_06384 [Mikania micrantha]